MDRGAWWATVHGVAESDMTKQADVTYQGLYWVYFTLKSAANLFGDFVDFLKSVLWRN